MANTGCAGKTVIVTGGASGIGLAIVQYFAAQSTITAILDISASSAQAVISSLRTKFPTTTFLFKKCDVSSWEEQKVVFGEIYKETGSIDYVFANAGVSEIGNFLDRDIGDPVQPTLKTMDINLVGVLYTVKLAIHYMRKKTSARKGSIICTASNAGIYPFPVAPIYGISKHGVVGAVRSLAKPLESDGIQINGICPNVIETGLADGNLFAQMILTPISVAIDAVREFVTKPDITGIIAEISGEKVTIREPPDWVDDISKTNFDSFWSLGRA